MGEMGLGEMGQNRRASEVVGKMGSRKCGMALIGGSVKPRDRCHSAHHRNDNPTSRAVKCRPETREMQRMTQECVCWGTRIVTHFVNALSVKMS